MLQSGELAPAVFHGAAAALLDEMLFPLLHAECCGGPSRLRQYQALTAAWVQLLVEAAEVVIAALAAKSSASLACHARAVSVTARCAAILSSTARRR